MTLDPIRPDAALIVRNNLDNRTYEAILDEEVVGVVVYESGDSTRLVLTHAAVEEHHRHHGIGTRLITWMLDDIRAQNLHITVYCDVVVRFLHDHPEYSDLIDPNHPGHADTES
jgi:predicted GNAT family acetyltransferase